MASRRVPLYPHLKLAEHISGKRFRLFFMVGKHFAVKEVTLQIPSELVSEVAQEGATGLSAGFPHEWSAITLYEMRGRGLQRARTRTRVT